MVQEVKMIILFNNSAIYLLHCFHFLSFFTFVDAFEPIEMYLPEKL